MEPHKTNLGICLGRIVFSFLVICCHFFTNGPGEEIIRPLRGMAVPFFFIISCYLTEQSISSRSHSTDPIRSRIRRIYRPLWFWGGVLAPFYAATVLFPWNGCVGLATAAKGIALQLLFGHVYVRPLWFLFLLGLFQTFQLGVSKLNLPRQTVFVGAIALLVLSYSLQYSGINYRMWNRFSPAIGIPFGRIAECLPFAVAGMSLFWSKFERYFSSNRSKWLYVLLLVVLSYPFAVLPFSTNPDFGHAGLFKARSGVALTMLFLIFPFSGSPKWLNRAIKSVADVSLGVYCTHVFIGIALVKAMSALQLQTNDLALCFVVYFVSVLVCKTILALFGDRLKPFLV